VRWFQQWGGTVDNDDDKVKHQAADFIGMCFKLLPCNERCRQQHIKATVPSKTVPGSGIAAV
jgi:hypothetical protein